MHGLWGMGQMIPLCGTKYVVVDDVDAHNTCEVLFRLCANTDPQRDSSFIPRLRDQRQQTRHRRDEKTAGRRVQTPLAAADQDGCGGEGEGDNAFQSVAADVRKLILNSPRIPTGFSPSTQGCQE